MTIKRTWSLGLIKRSANLESGYSEMLAGSEKSGKFLQVVSETVLSVCEIGWLGPEIARRYYKDEINGANLVINRGWGRKVEFSYTPSKER